MLSKPCGSASAGPTEKPHPYHRPAYPAPRP